VKTFEDRYYIAVDHVARAIKHQSSRDDGIRLNVYEASVYLAIVFDKPTKEVVEDVNDTLCELNSGHEVRETSGEAS
jgi:hypothetical protein